MAQCPLKNTNFSTQNRDSRNQIIRTDESCCTSSSTQVGSVAPVFDGESMMLRRNMLKVPLKIEPAQQKYSFRTQGKAYGKLCR